MFSLAYSEVTDMAKQKKPQKKPQEKKP